MILHTYNRITNKHTNNGITYHSILYLYVRMSYNINAMHGGGQQDIHHVQNCAFFNEQPAMENKLFCAFMRL